ncbi:MAG: right-handed parallel beta-helix repeat-containing protein [Acidobacteriaceae bacterium]
MLIHSRIAPRCRILFASALFALASASLASAATLCVQPQGHLGCQKTIGAAVAAAAPGAVIYVWPGVYKEEVTITQSVSLVAVPGSNTVIDATGLPNGIFIDGRSGSPNAGVSNVLISGFDVRNANFEGILVLSGSNITLTDNHVHNNDLSLDIAAGDCPNQPAFETNEGDDCGEGIHLMGADHSTVRDSEVDHNSGGILISDESGPNQSNLITGNSVHDNAYDCGITLASHPPAVDLVPSATVSFGVWNNTISHNDSYHNGTQVPGAGAGVGIFAAGPGTTNTGNVVIGNTLRNNGMPGFAMHNHAAPPGAPPVNLNNNVIVGNTISGNAADTADTATAGPTGINIASQAPISGMVISGNDIDNEAIAIAYSAPSGQLSVHFNDLPRSIGIENLGTGTIDATENWWNCANGPGSGHCASVSGTGINTAPWLFTPAAVNY